MSAQKQNNCEIRIYPSFTEVREAVEAKKPYQIYMPQDLFNQIMPGSLSLEGLEVLSMLQVLKTNNLEGKTIHVRREKEVRQVKVVRGNDLLVQDLETKRYFNVSNTDIEHSEIPAENGTEITFTLGTEGKTTLSYLMYGLRWTPRYNLNITGEAHALEGWADIANNTRQEYLVDKTELFGGDVNIQRGHRGPGGVRMMAMASKMSSNAAAAPRIKSEGEVAGLYAYSIGDQYLLAPQSTYSLPFAKPTIELEKIAVSNAYFNAANDKGKFERVYRIKSSEFLPAGSVTVREDSRVVGQSNIPDLAASESNDLTVGSDADVSYSRVVNRVSTSETLVVYSVQLTIKNNKARPMKVEYREAYGNDHEVKSEDAAVVFANDSLKVNATVPAKEEKTFAYTVNQKVEPPRHYN